MALKIIKKIIVTNFNNLKLNILWKKFVELMEKYLPYSYFDKNFIKNLVDLFEEIDVNGDGGMEWDVWINRYFINE